MEIIAVIIAGLSLLIATLSYFSSRKTAHTASERASKAERLAEGGLELSLTESISSSKQRVIEASIAWSNFKSDKPDQSDDLYKKAFYASLEDNLNAYEKACSLYLDEKIDKIRFEKDYTREIMNLVENEAQNDRYFNPPNTSLYKAILKVYDKWFNLEK
ncbi:MAG: hypothetical protein AAGF85_19955 [Bacteroidota bacterium]